MAKARKIGRVAIYFLALVLLWVSGVWAAPTTSEQARLVVTNWLAIEAQPLGARIGQQVKEVKTFADASGPVYYVVYLEPAGLVFLPADDLVEPILAFAPEAVLFDPSPANPLGAVGRDAMGRVLQARQQQRQARAAARAFVPPAPMQTAQRKWAQMALGQLPAQLGMGSEGTLSHKETISDVRVAPFVDIWWSQSVVDRDVASSPHCYDYFTTWRNPQNLVQWIYYPCGCATTAEAQLMRFHSHPKVPVDARTFKISIKPPGQVASPKWEPLLRGETPDKRYDWANMPKDPMHPPVPLTETNRRAIGALTHDVAVALQSTFDKDGTLAGNPLYVALSLTQCFKYQNAIFGWNGQNYGKNIPLNDLYNMVNTNLDAGLPVILSIAGFRPNPKPPPTWSVYPAHWSVTDGYGYDWGTMYHHLAIGWGGGKTGKANSIWYNLPTVDTPVGYHFPVVNICVYNVYPSGTGEIISGRVTGPCGIHQPGVKVTASSSAGTVITWTNDKGIYALPKVPANTKFTIHAEGTGFVDQVVTTGKSINNSGPPICGNRWGANFKAGRSFVVNPEYQLFSLASDTGKMSIAYAINNLGIVVGGMKANNSNPEYHAAAWAELQRGMFTSFDLGTLGGNGAELRGINDKGLAVGWSRKTGSTGHYPCYASPVDGNTKPTLVPLPLPNNTFTLTPNGMAFGVNKKGVIVGWTTYNFKTSGDRVSPCYWPSTASAPQALFQGAFLYNYFNHANRINDSGYIVGQDGNRAFLWQGGNRTDLGPGGTNSEALGVSNLNKIAGILGSVWDHGTNIYTGTPKAVIFAGQSFQSLDPNGKAPAAFACNSMGQVVGRSFLWDPQKGFRALNILVNEPDWDLVDAFDINEAGEIVGWGWYKCFPLAFLLRPMNLDTTFYLITATAGPGGTISPSGAVRVSLNTSLLFDIVADPGL